MRVPYERIVTCCGNKYYILIVIDHSVHGQGAFLLLLNQSVTLILEKLGLTG